MSKIDLFEVGTIQILGLLDIYKYQPAEADGLDFPVILEHYKEKHDAIEERRIRRIVCQENTFFFGGGGMINLTRKHMNTSEDLLVSLLRKQNITDFHELKINGENSDYYGYIHSDSFYFCDKDFSVKERSKIGIQEGGVIRIGKDGDSYFWPFNGQKQSIVVDATNKIISVDAEGFFEINKETFLMHDPIWINDYSRGIVYDVVSNEFIAGDCGTPVLPIQRKKPALHWCGENKYIDEESPINPYVNGVKGETLQYLFSYKDENNYRGYCSSYFVNVSDKTVVVITTSNNEQESRKVEFKAEYIWLSDSLLCCIGFDLIKPNPKDHSTSHKLCVKTFSDNHGELISYVEVHWVCNPYITNVSATKYHIMIVGEFTQTNQIVIVVDDIGRVVTNRLIQCSQIERKHYIISIIDINGSTAFYDLIGKKITEDRWSGMCPDYIVIERNFTVPTRFCDVEISAQTQIEERNCEQIFDDYTDNNIYDTFKGVMNTWAMEVIVPPCYSFVKPDTFKKPFSTKEYPKRLFTIVRIDNYYKGKKDSVYGAYLDEKIVLPIGFNNIEVLNYAGSDSEGNEYQYMSDYVLLENEKSLGLATTWGEVIIEPSAESIDLLINGKDEPIYAKIYENGETYLVYKTMIIKIDGLDNAEATIWSCSNDPIVKVVKEGLCGIMYKGKMLTDFYSDIKPRPSLYGQKKQYDNFDYVFIVEDEVGNKGMLNRLGETIVPVEHSNIEVYQRMALIDGTFYDESGEKVFCTKGYLQVDKVIKCYSLPCNDALFCFKNDNGYVIVNAGIGYIDEFDANYHPDEAPTYYCFGEYIFDFEEEVFKEKEEDYSDYGNYDDDYDYYRDTYYALGGDDYDEFRERGGSIDDMMDKMGF